MSKVYCPYCKKVHEFGVSQTYQKPDSPGTIVRRRFCTHTHKTVITEEKPVANEKERDTQQHL